MFSSGLVLGFIQTHLSPSTATSQSRYFIRTLPGSNLKRSTIYSLPRPSSISPGDYCISTLLPNPSLLKNQDDLIFFDAKKSLHLKSVIK